MKGYPLLPGTAIEFAEDSSGQLAIEYLLTMAGKADFDEIASPRLMIVNCFEV